MKESVPAWVSNFGVQPLAVEDVRVSSADGHRAVFFKLSRFADAIRHEATSEPARIRLELAGPAVGADMPEERVVTADDVVRAVRISRSGGTVRITLELDGETPPDYSVREMADWIMVRLFD